MKLAEIVTVHPTAEQLNELDLKKAAAGGALALSTLLAPSTSHSPVPSSPPTSAQPAPTQPAPSRAQLDIALLTNTILKKYSVSPELAQKVATLAKKYEKESFPKAEDILSIVGIESSFRPHVKSALQKDPAIGLMQVRPGVWGVDPHTLAGSLDKQIQIGADVLHKYYNILGDKSAAVHAYNVGLGNFRKGKHNPNYVSKFKNERKLYRS